MQVNIGLIHKVRVSKGCKQSTVADALGITQAHYSKLEKGEVEFNLQLLSKLIDHLELNPLDVITFSEQQQEAIDTMLNDSSNSRCECAIRSLIQDELKKVCGRCRDKK